jgi:hypothetical protein
VVPATEAPAEEAAENGNQERPDGDEHADDPEL